MNIFQNQNAADALRLSLSQGGAEMRLGEHFRLAEMASGDGSDLVLVHPALLVLLVTLRRHFGAPVTINSGYRSPAHNRAIGGARQSIHMLGMAADVAIRGYTPREVQQYAESLGVGGLGRYPTFTHVDVAGQGRRWAG